MLQQSDAQNVVQLPLPFEGYPAKVTPPKGWSYLLADSLAFKKDVNHAIRMQKPREEHVPGWIKKLILSGQCKTLYVENLTLSENDRLSIRKLCALHDVSLVNLTVMNDDTSSNSRNVIIGPW